MALTTRDRMLRTMGRLLQRQGFTATGLNEVLAKSQAPKGSMYHHFPAGKEQLAAEAVRGSGAVLEVAMTEALNAAPTALAGVRAIIDAMAVSLEESGFRAGCPIATVALEVSSSSEVVRHACAEVFASWEARIADRLTSDGADARLATESATMVLATLEGALLLSRTTQDTAPLAIAARLTDRLLPA